MAYYPDLSTYRYSGHTNVGTLNVGWLHQDKPFSKARPDADFLDALWDFCSIRIAATRGVHECSICNPDAEMAVAPGTMRATETTLVEYRDEQRLLGSAEIRVFGNLALYAAPTLIFHYVQAHQYRPPDDFISAVRSDLRPPNPHYFSKLAALDLEWIQSD